MIALSRRSVMPLRNAARNSHPLSFEQRPVLDVEVGSGLAIVHAIVPGPGRGHLGPGSPSMFGRCSSRLGAPARGPGRIVHKLHRAEVALSNC
jgi:hypothetical protein